MIREKVMKTDLLWTQIMDAESLKDISTQELIDIVRKIRTEWGIT